MKNAVILAPFWRQAGHVGCHRVARLVRWLYEDGITVTLVCAGSTVARLQTIWGEEIAVGDPLGVYPDSQGSASPIPLRRPNRLRRWVANWVFVPDPGIVWARAVARSAVVRSIVANAQVLISSSPPESAHVGGRLLAEDFGVPHIVDLRDGWLDEPLKATLRTSRCRRVIEGRAEQRVLLNARHIVVTSTVWRDMLCKRMPNLSGRVSVLTNGYPARWPGGHQEASIAPRGTEIVLVYAGRFSGSDLRRRPDGLLAPLLSAVRLLQRPGVVRLIGEFTGDDLAAISRYRTGEYRGAGWAIECVAPMPHEAVMRELEAASGLLIVSASRAAIPSKLFECIAAGRPMFVVTERDSAAWRVCEGLPQACMHDGVSVPDDAAKRFARLMTLDEVPSVQPPQFADAQLKHTWNHEILQSIRRESM